LTAVQLHHRVFGIRPTLKHPPLRSRPRCLPACPPPERRFPTGHPIPQSLRAHSHFPHFTTGFPFLRPLKMHLLRISHISHISHLPYLPFPVPPFPLFPLKKLVT
jgi:hypothetical protein